MNSQVNIDLKDHDRFLFRVYLMRQIMRQYGMDALRQIGENPDTHWVVPDEAKNPQVCCRFLSRVIMTEKCILKLSISVGTCRKVHFIDLSFCYSVKTKILKNVFVKIV